MHSLNPSSADLPTLDLLRRLAQCGSLSQSAAQLGISISKASKMLGAARVLFGDKLFIRTNAGMLPTTRMRELEFTIGRVFADLEILLAEPQTLDLSTVRAQLRFAASDHAFAVCLSPILNELSRRAPNVFIRVEPPSAATMEQLRRGDADFLIVQDEQLRLDGGFHSVVLLESEHVLLMREGNPLAARLRAARSAAERLDVLAEVEIIETPVHLPSGLTSPAPASWSAGARSAASIPYFYGAAELALHSDKAMIVTRAFAEVHAAGRGAEVVELDPAPPLWRPKLIWHERTHRDPLCEWMRSCIIASARGRGVSLL